jgi:hypothetical protein
MLAQPEARQGVLATLRTAGRPTLLAFLAGEPALSKAEGVGYLISSKSLSPARSLSITYPTPIPR